MSSPEERKLMKGTEKHIRVPWWDKLPVKGRKSKQWWDDYEPSDDMRKHIASLGLTADKEASYLNLKFWVDTGWDEETLIHYGYIQRKPGR